MRLRSSCGGSSSSRSHQRPAVQPGHGQQALGAELVHRHRDMHAGIVAEHHAVEPHLRGLARVIQLLAQPLGQFLVDLVLLDGVVHAVIDRHRQLQLAQIGFHRARHVGILQLAGDHRCRRAAGAMHLAEARRGGGLVAELGESRSASPGRVRCAMRRRTKAQPIGGALACSCASSAAYSAGSASGTVDRNCATFISGPFSPPRMACRSSAWLARSVLMPNTRCAGHARGDAADRAGGARHAAELAEQVMPCSPSSAIAPVSHAASLQLVDEAGDHVQPARPERRVGGVQPERRQQLLVPLGAAGAQHVEVFRLEARMAGLEHRIQRVHQAIAERIGVDIERRVDEMRHIGPEHVVFRRELERRPEAFGLHLQPDLADPLGQQLAAAALVVQQRLEPVERDLPHHRVQHVLDLAGQHDPPARAGRSRHPAGRGRSASRRTRWRSRPASAACRTSGSPAPPAST